LGGNVKKPKGKKKGHTNKNPRGVSPAERQSPINGRQRKVGGKKGAVTLRKFKKRERETFKTFGDTGENWGSQKSRGGKILGCLTTSRNRKTPKQGQKGKS